MIKVKFDQALLLMPEKRHVLESIFQYILELQFELNQSRTLLRQSVEVVDSLLKEQESHTGRS